MSGGLRDSSSASPHTRSGEPDAILGNMNCQLALEEGRALFKSRVTLDIYNLNLYDRAIVDVMIKSKGHVKSRIW